MLHVKIRLILIPSIFADLVNLIGFSLAVYVVMVIETYIVYLDKCPKMSLKQVSIAEVVDENLVEYLRTMLFVPCLCDYWVTGLSLVDHIEDK